MKVKRCLWLKSFFKHIQISIENYYIGFGIYLMKDSFILSLGWIDIYFTFHAPKRCH